MTVARSSSIASDVAVALCTYQGGSYVREQLATILDQDCLPGEIVVSDDGSTDSTLDLVEGALSEARRRGIQTRLLRNESPMGVTANFEAALTSCTREIIILCDQDDIWAPDRVSQVKATFVSNPAATLIQGDAFLVDAKGRRTGVMLFEALGLTPREVAQLRGGDAFAALLKRNLATGATMAIKRALLLRALPFPREWLHDEWLAIISAAQGGVAVSAKPTVSYRQHGLNQVGVQRATMRYRIRRMLDSEPDRNNKLALRSDTLHRRLSDLGAAVQRPIVDEARSKARFEKGRAEYKMGMLARVPAVIKVAKGGGYGRFASQGRLDIVRDLLRGARFRRR